MKGYRPTPNVLLFHVTVVIVVSLYVYTLQSAWISGIGKQHTHCRVTVCDECDDDSDLSKFPRQDMCCVYGLANHLISLYNVTINCNEHHRTSVSERYAPILDQNRSDTGWECKCTTVWRCDKEMYSTTYRVTPLRCINTYVINSEILLNNVDMKTTNMSLYQIFQMRALDGTLRCETGTRHHIGIGGASPNHRGHHACSAPNGTQNEQVWLGCNVSFRGRGRPYETRCICLIIPELTFYVKNAHMLHLAILCRRIVLKPPQPYLQGNCYWTRSYKAEVSSLCKCIQIHHRLETDCINGCCLELYQSQLYEHDPFILCLMNHEYIDSVERTYSKLTVYRYSAVALVLFLPNMCLLCCRTVFCQEGERSQYSSNDEMNHALLLTSCIEVSYEPFIVYVKSQPCLLLLLQLQLCIHGTVETVYIPERQPILYRYTEERHSLIGPVRTPYAMRTYAVYWFAGWAIVIVCIITNRCRVYIVNRCIMAIWGCRLSGLSACEIEIENLAVIRK